jgi:hypothetical protein
MKELTITFTFDELYYLKEIIFEKNTTGLPDTVETLEAMCNVFRKALDNKDAEQQTKSLLKQLNIKTK